MTFNTRYYSTNLVLVPLHLSHPLTLITIIHVIVTRSLQATQKTILQKLISKISQLFLILLLYCLRIFTAFFVITK